MTDSREHAHQLIDCLPEAQLSALLGLLETIGDPAIAALRNAPIDDERRPTKKHGKSARLVSGSGRMAAKASRTARLCAAWECWNWMERLCACFV